MTDFLAALGLVLVLEGLLYAAFPVAIMKMLESLKEIPISRLRISGLVVMGVGVMVVWLVRGSV